MGEKDGLNEILSIGLKTSVGIKAKIKYLEKLFSLSVSFEAAKIKILETEEKATVKVIKIAESRS